jgi:hypothetical protein
MSSDIDKVDAALMAALAYFEATAIAHAQLQGQTRITVSPLMTTLTEARQALHRVRDAVRDEDVKGQ